MPGHQDQPCIAVSSLPLAPGVPHTQSERGTSGGGGRQGATRLGCLGFCQVVCVAPQHLLYPCFECRVYGWEDKSLDLGFRGVQ